MFRSAGVPIDLRTTAPAPSGVSMLLTFLDTPRDSSLAVEAIEDLFVEVVG